MREMLSTGIIVCVALVVGFSIGYKEGQNNPPHICGLAIEQVKWLVIAYLSGKVTIHD